MQAVQTEFDLTSAPADPVATLIEMVQAYRQRADEPILAWAERAKVARPRIVDVFLNAGGILWGEDGIGSRRPRMLFAELQGGIGAELWQPRYPFPEFLPVLRWVEDVDMRRSFGMGGAA